MKVGRWKPEEQSPSSNIPHEIIVDILSRLPVKDLLRFRVVCKQWDSTISDPIFTEIHRQQQYKNPSSRNLIAWEYRDYSLLNVGELRNNCIEFVSAIKFGLGLGSDTDTLCSCDGLYLKRPHDKCVLWNPSRRTYRELYCPIPVDRTCRTIQGMYYDQLMKDYKIVIGDKKHYAVYSCRDNKWGNVKEMEIFWGDCCSNDYGVFVNGSIYWLLEDSDDVDECEVIYFDCKDESFESLSLPDCYDPNDIIFNLTSFGGQLCLLISDGDGHWTEIMKKVSSGDEWMESKEDCLCVYRPKYLCCFLPMCQMSENEILLLQLGFLPPDKSCVRRLRQFYMVYDKSKNTLVEIPFNSPTVYYPRLFKHQENLFLL